MSGHSELSHPESLQAAQPVAEDYKGRRYFALALELIFQNAMRVK
jgi:hypothetical protein